MNVLLLDDDETALRAMCEALCRDTDMLLRTSDLETALRMAADCRPDVAVIDVHLGAGVMGTDFPALLNPDWPLGVLFISGYGFEAQLGKAGGHALLRKPFSAAELRGALPVVRDLATHGDTVLPVPARLRRLPPADWHPWADASEPLARGPKPRGC